MSLLYNKAQVIGNIDSILYRGKYNNRDYALVSMNVQREQNRPQSVLVLLNEDSFLKDLLRNKSKVQVDGKLDVSYNFSNVEKKFAFIVPSGLKRLPNDYNAPREDEFYLDYTAHNRVSLCGQVIKDPICKSVDNKTIYRFKFAFDDGIKTINCDAWDTVQGVSELKAGKRIRIVGCFNTYTLEDVKTKKEYRLYKVLVQHIDSLD